VIIDVGAQNTDLIIAEANSAWMRNIPLGGNNFTEALVKAFKLSFAKAESLKRTASSSKYARQIFQAMRPIFSELVSEVQRSLGYYGSTHRDIELEKLVVLGNAFQLPGLQKYIEQNLTLEKGVHKPEKFETLTPSATINAPQFTENLLSFGAAYGLALQGVGEAKINASLLPTELARVAVWKRKVPYWIATAACLGLAAFAPWGRNIADAQALESGESQRLRSQVQSIVGEAQRLSSEFNEVSMDTSSEKGKIDQLLGLSEHAKVLPNLLELVHEALPDVDADLKAARTRTEFRRALSAGKIPPRNQRKQIFIDSLLLTYDAQIEGMDPSRARRRSLEGGRADRGGSRNRDEAGGSSGDGGPGFYVHLTGRLLYSENPADALRVLTEEFQKRLRTFGRREGRGFYVLVDEASAERPVFNERPTMKRAVEDASRGGRRGGGDGGGGDRQGGTIDPVTGESMDSDWLFEFGFRIRLGEPPAEAEEAATEEDSSASEND
jgi:type IV pilus assembly protein PilM